jgi:hypothetical protein
VPPREPQAAPPRADDDTSPGLALIERALADDGRPEDVRPDDDDDVVAADETVLIEPIVDPVLDEAVPEAVTERLRPVPDGPAEPAPDPATDPAVAEPTPEPEAGKTPKTGKGRAAKGGGRTSDLALLRTNSAVRARVVAAVVVPFVFYVGVLLVLDNLDIRTALIWIWIPLVTAGVVGGLMLDIGHREAAAHAASAATAATAGAEATEDTEAEPGARP